MDELERRLRARATVWAKNITQEVNKSDKPKHIRVKSRVSVNGGKFQIVTTASSRKGDARAYEYGSGIHSRLRTKSPNQLGSKGKILIRPKKKRLLAFYWEPFTTFEWDRPGKKFVKVLDDNRKAFRYVEHPGVKAKGGGKGYLAPAIAKVRRQIRKEVQKDVREAYFAGVRKVFKK